MVEPILLPPPRKVRRRYSLWKINSSAILLMVMCAIGGVFFFHSHSIVDAAVGAPGGCIFGLVFSSIFLTTLWVGFLLPSRRQRALVRAGTPAPGKILKRRYYGKESEFYFVSYEFHVGDRTYQSEMQVTNEDGSRLYDSADVTVLFRGNPKRSVIYEACQFEVDASR